MNFPIRSRIRSVDTFRILAIIFVIIIHTTPFKEIDVTVSDYLYVILNQIARFAVPFFFVISGFFYGLKIDHFQNDSLAYTITRVKYLLLLWAAWSFVYIMPYDINTIFSYGLLGPIKIVYWKLCDLISNPVRTLFEGSKVHLWYLNALIWATIIVWLFHKNTRLLIIISIALYIFGLLSKSYAQTPIGFSISFNTRNGPFFATLLFTAGYLLSKHKVRESWLYKGLICFSFGAMLHFTEIFFLWKFYDHYPAFHDYVIGTFFMGLGAALIALSNHQRLNFLSGLSKAGQFTLGIYCVHFIFVANLKALEHVFHPISDILYPFLVFILSYYLSLLISKNKHLAKLVC